MSRCLLPSLALSLFAAACGAPPPDPADAGLDTGLDATTADDVHDVAHRRRLDASFHRHRHDAGHDVGPASLDASTMDDTPDAKP